MLQKISLFLTGAGLALWALTSESRAPLLTLLAVLIHEGGHLFAARRMHRHPSGVSADTVGIRLWFDGTPLSYPEEILLCAAGPLANLLSIPFALPFCAENPFFLSVSLALALLNLLPIEGFDGGRILSATLSLFLTPTRADRICEACSFLFLFTLWCASVYLLMRTGNELSLFFFTAALFFRIFLQKKPR